MRIYRTGKNDTWKKGVCINFKSKRTLSDSLGNHGRGRYKGSGLLENKNKIITDMLYFCELKTKSMKKFGQEEVEQVHNNKQG